MKKVVTNYQDLSQAEFLEFLIHMPFCMDPNTNFPTPPVTIASIVAKQVSWQGELNKSKNGDHVATEAAKVIYKSLIRDVKTNGDYINNTANGNAVMLESCGYRMAKEHVFQPKPDVKVIAGKIAGTGTIVIDAIPGAITYLVETCGAVVPAPDNNFIWTRQKMSPRATILFTGLESLKKLHLRYCYVTIIDESPYSQPYEFSLP